jgi:hypothetical protein
VRLYGGERIVCGTDGTEFGCDWTRKAAPGDKALRLAELSRKDFVLWSYGILNGKLASRTELPHMPNWRDSDGNRDRTANFEPSVPRQKDVWEPSFSLGSARVFSHEE